MRFTNKVSCGILLYRFTGGSIQFYLVHPGGPFFRRKDDGHWGIPKGEIEPGEDALTAAIRETLEETGIAVQPPYLPLETVTLKSGKTVHGWGARYNLPGDPVLVSNTLEINWPPYSRNRITIPEVDRGEFFFTDEARIKIKKAQEPFIDRLLRLLVKEGKTGLD